MTQPIDISPGRSWAEFVAGVAWNTAYLRCKKVTSQR